MVKAIEVMQVICPPFATIVRADFFKCPGFGQFGINWKLLNVNIIMADENYDKCEF